MKKSASHSWVFARMRRDLGFIICLTIVSSVSTCLSIALALLSRQVLDIATGDATGNLLMCGIGLILVLVLQIVLEVLVSYTSAWITGRIEMRMRDRVFAALFQKRWKDFSAHHSGELLNRLTSDTQVVVNGMVMLLPRAVSFVARIIACGVVLVILDWRIAVIMLVLGGVMMVSSRLYGRRMKQIHKDCQASDGHTRAYIQESLENWMVIQSFGGSGVVGQRLMERMRVYFANILRRNRWSNFSFSVLRLAFSGSYYVALAWGASQLAVGAVTFGTLMAFLQIISQIRMPLMNMSNLLPQYYNMLASAERLMELEALPDEPRLDEKLDLAVLYDELECLRLSGVSFAYDTEHPVLVKNDFSLNKGEFVALTGFSGIGKSTLFKLLLGFYAPEEGRVEAVTAKKIIPLGADTRCLFAYVPQQNMLLSGTVRDNIAQFAQDATEEMIWQAAEIAEVADAIRELPKGLDTVLRERGSGMSEGQLQRLAIARAVLSGAPILLLDEATASLDSVTEERVLRNLRGLSDRTCLCISHRPAALALCDRVIRLEDGHCVEA